MYTKYASMQMYTNVYKCIWKHTNSSSANVPVVRIWVYKLNVSWSNPTRATCYNSIYSNLL